jgi:hypothetical protein
MELRALVENGIYELAPDVTSLEILGLEEPSATGFVALESLLGPAMTESAREQQLVHAGSES